MEFKIHAQKILNGIAMKNVPEIIYVVLGGDNLYETEGLASVSYQNDILSVNWISFFVHKIISRSLQYLVK